MSLWENFVLSMVKAELPVIVNIHGGALIEGNKNFSVGFCRQLAKRGYLITSKADMLERYTLDFAGKRAGGG